MTLRTQMLLIKLAAYAMVALALCAVLNGCASGPNPAQAGYENATAIASDLKRELDTLKAEAQEAILKAKDIQAKGKNPTEYLELVAALMKKIDEKQPALEAMKDKAANFKDELDAQPTGWDKLWYILGAVGGTALGLGIPALRVIGNLRGALGTVATAVEEAEPGKTLGPVKKRVAELTAPNDTTRKLIRKAKA